MVLRTCYCGSEIPIGKIQCLACEEKERKILTPNFHERIAQAAEEYENWGTFIRGAQKALELLAAPGEGHGPRAWVKFYIPRPHVPLGAWNVRPAKEACYDFPEYCPVTELIEERAKCLAAEANALKDAEAIAEIQWHSEKYRREVLHLQDYSQKLADEASAEITKKYAAENALAAEKSRCAELEKRLLEFSEGFWGRFCSNAIAQRDAEREKVAKLREALKDAIQRQPRDSKGYPDWYVEDWEKALAETEDK